MLCFPESARITGIKPAMPLRHTLPLAFAALLVLGSAGRACAASSQPIPVFVNAQADDTGGSAVAYALRERLAASREFSLADTEKDAAFQLQLVTEDPIDGTRAGSITVYSLVLTMHNPDKQIGVPLFLDSWVGICHTATADTCARPLFASAASDMTHVLTLLRSAISKRDQALQGQSAQDPSASADP